jgi:ATP/maltotriose-dependent transcriptional regulator MalT
VASSNKAAKTDLEAQSDALLAKVLLQQGKIKDAQDAADRAVVLAQKLDRTSRFEAAIAAARVDMGAGKFAEAKNKLAPVLAQATEKGYLLYVFDARLALGEVALKSRQTGAARAQLAALEKDARAKGFLLTARKAAALARS